MPGLAIAAGVLALLILLLLGRVSLAIRYDTGLSVTLGWLFFRGTLYPKKKDKGKKKTKRGQAKESVRKEMKPDPFRQLVEERGIAAAVGEVCGLMRAVLSRFGRLLSHVKADPLELELTVAGEDAAATAVEYGGVCALVYPLIGAVWSAVRVGRFRADIRPDFDGGQWSARLRVRLRLRPIFALWFVWLGAMDYIKWKSARPAENGIQNSIKEGAGK